MKPDGTVDTGLGMAKAQTQDTNSFNWTNMVPAGVGGILDILTSKQQFDRQRKLNRENQQLQLEMWEKTNYPAQRAMMEKAGLNPALMYGQGGGGGTTANITSGNVSAPTAEGQKGEIGMAMQMGLMQAQQELIKAQTDKTKVETKVTEGAGTEQILANIEQIKTLTKKYGLEAEGQTFENTLKDVQSNVAQKTEEEAIKQIQIATQKLGAETQQAMAKSNVDNATIETEIQRQKDAGAEQALKVLLTKANINATEQQIKNGIESIKRMQSQTEQGQQQIEIQKLLQEFNTSTPQQIKQWTEIIGSIMKGIK